ncbi:hypothetical protein M501DRAFT_1014377 [Patellaria atrata CBS 101060]|uniref:Filamentation protein n=1 Tax=Patellaria atrata CBS 101060 TaxID=1346257 RepID=A0A9P4SFI4_9PEZI|nr:hypothetical protein M501DRAFT_1014377 [Patellaria atrata CBS 101060]
MSAQRENEKATRYLSLLDDVRCNARWSEVPELARKIEKHAPHRKCLALTARSETNVASHQSQEVSTTVHPSSNSDLAQRIPLLFTAIEQETQYPLDAFQGMVCIGWIHWALGEPRLAVSTLPKDFESMIMILANHEKQNSEWTKVCVVKGACLKGMSQEKISTEQEAIQTYTSVLPFLETLQPLNSGTPQLLFWVEQLLTHLCLLTERTTRQQSFTDSHKITTPFRVWARLWQPKPGHPNNLITTESAETSKARRSVWKAYYDTLSMILRNGMSYSQSPTLQDGTWPAENEKYSDLTSARLQQRAELKRVETTYESLLLKETRFPKANQINHEVREWVEAVIANWRVMCGPTWTDKELGEGGKSGVGHGVLDILYRAATKTFHSSQILRHLFSVHASLAEFELAMKAFDAYVEIVARAKDRIEKSGEEEVDLDDDDTILRTGAEAIRILCRFGSRKEAEKAREIANIIEKWISQHRPSSRQSNSAHVQLPTTDDSNRIEGMTVSPHALAVSYHAIGMSQAQWARVTYETASRAGLQSQAILNFQRSLRPEFEDPYNLNTMYSLGLVLAETRDINGAIIIVKQALATRADTGFSFSPDGALSESTQDFPGSPYSRERKLIALWHLLALLLTSRSEFITAEKACEAAFQQFRDPTHLFGPDNQSDEYRSDHLNELSEKSLDQRPRALVDQMQAFEKEGIVQVKMTQMAITEVLEGASAAVDASDELLALYARLFGEPHVGQIRSDVSKIPLSPPKTASQTIRGSILGRSRTVKGASDRSTIRSDRASTARESLTSRPDTTMTQTTMAPTIQVTDETGYSTNKQTGHHHHHLPFHHKTPDHSPQTRSQNVKLRKKSVGSLKNRASEGHPVARNDGITETDFANASPNPNTASSASPNSQTSRRGSVTQTERKSVESPDQPLRSINHNMDHSANLPPTGHSRQPPKQDVRLPAPFPSTSSSTADPPFASIDERRHSISLLVQIWIFISGLYMRAVMFEESKAAIDEAFKLVEGFQHEVAQGSSSIAAFADRGWGGGKSVEELWADVWAERGNLALARESHHAALSYFEKALSHFPDHPTAVVRHSSILLDIHSQKVPPEVGDASTTSRELLHRASLPHKMVEDGSSGTSESASEEPSDAAHTSIPVSPKKLNRLAARDRAFSLLSSLTKLGSGWDRSEAWFTLARAYEEGGQIEKAKEILWWCVELEDKKPIRPWHSVGVGGFVL